MEFPYMESFKPQTEDHLECIFVERDGMPGRPLLALSTETSSPESSASRDSWSLSPRQLVTMSIDLVFSFSSKEFKEKADILDIGGEKIRDLERE